MKTTVIRLYTFFTLVCCLCLSTARAQAQYRPRPIDDPATGESYHIEGSVALWYPTATMGISSESLGIQGSPIDLKNDLDDIGALASALDVTLGFANATSNIAAETAMPRR